MPPTLETQPTHAPTLEATANAVPIRVLVRMFERYPDAADAVERLRRNGLSGDRVTVIGEDLRWVRGNDPARGVARAAWSGATIGATVGLVTWLTGLGDADVGLFILASLGAIVGTIVAVLGFGIWWHGTQDDATVPETGRVEPQRYDVLVDEAHAERAVEVLRG